MVQQPRLNTSADVLEGPRRPVEKLEHPRAVRDLDERDREVEGVPHERMEVLGGDFVAQQVLADDRRDLDDIGGPDGVQTCSRQRLEPLRKIQSPVRRGAREKRVDKRDRGRRTPCRNPLHRNWPTLSLRRTPHLRTLALRTLRTSPPRTSSTFLNRRHACTGSGRIDTGRPRSSTATSTTSAWVTLTASPACGCGPIPHRSASTDTRTVMDVRPTRTVSV